MRAGTEKRSEEDCDGHGPGFRFFASGWPITSQETNKALKGLRRDSPVGESPNRASPGLSVNVRAQKNTAKKLVPAPAPDSFDLGPGGRAENLKNKSAEVPWPQGV